MHDIDSCFSFTTGKKYFRGEREKRERERERENKKMENECLSPRGSCLHLNIHSVKLPLFLNPLFFSFLYILLFHPPWGTFIRPRILERGRTDFPSFFRRRLLWLTVNLRKWHKHLLLLNQGGQF
jgi:hypothetical protein